MNIITLYNGINNKVISPFINRFIEYSSIHGYTFELKLSEFNSISYKTTYIYDKLQKTDSEYLVWIDMDCYIVDLEYPLEKIINRYPNNDLLYSKDSNGLCAGFCIIKKTDFTVKLFEILNFLYECDGKTDLISKSDIGGFLNENGNHYDQNVVKVLANYFPKVTREICMIDESIISNKTSNITNMPFIYHFWNIWNDTDYVLNKIKEFK
jgi:hypothetical protein